ncbi:hypothetical protein [Sphingomonas sp. PAMC 26617]|uniref:hypothetical protein n=1 Tax=Sphingomonas sp. PAMC 26617 TaxID=1112216 RepID=UPI0012F5140B|nr:hypothetical protein [Sphingomonas sp. PAMC 26617]
MTMLGQNSGMAGQFFQQGQNDARKQQIDDQNLALNASKLADLQHQAANDTAFQSDWSSYLKNPTTDALASIAVKYPDHTNAVKEFWSIKDPAIRQSHIQAIAPVISALQNNKPDLAISSLKQMREAATAAGEPTDDLDQEITALQSGDKDAINAVKGTMMMHLAAVDGDGKFAESLAKLRTSTAADALKGTVVGRSIGHYDADGKYVVDYRDPEAAQYREIKVTDPNTKQETTQFVPIGGGSVQTPGGSAVSTGDTSRLINTDAGGGYVPDSVKTIGQFVGFGKALNSKGAKSSSAGTYQINGSTMAEFAPKVLGSNWKQAPFNADTQDKVGEAIFNWAKQQADPAAALRGRWVSLNPQAASQLVQGDWSQARSTIAHGETGGAPGSSASVSSDAPSGSYSFVTKRATADNSGLTGPTYLATLPTGRASLIKAILDGRAPAPRPGSKFGEQLAEDIAQVDPSIDTTTLPMRQQARKDFTGNGKAAQVMSSLGRFAAHMNSAWENHLALGGMNLGPASGFVAGITQSFDPAHVKGYSQELEAIQGEFQKLSKNGAASETEAERLIGNAKPAQSEAGRAAALQAMAKLALAQYPQMINQWHSAFPDRPLPVDLQPGSMAALQNIIKGGRTALPVDHNGAPYAPRSRGQSSGGDTPMRVANVQQALSLPKGTPFIDPNGIRRIR